MNKTLMLVICDFLLLSMLAMARFDPPQEAPQPSLDATASAATAEAELIALLEASLQAEQGSRENLSADLQQTQQNLQEQARLLAEREAALEATRSDLEMTNAQAEALAREKARIEAEQAKQASESEALAQRYSRTREQLDEASRERLQLANTLGEAREARSVSEERLKQTEDALRQREIELAEREAALQAAEAEKARLAEARAELNQRLEVTETERRLLAESLSREQTEKQAALARADRLTDNVAVLGEGVSQIGQNVTTLAQTSEAMQKEIEAARPQTMSEIFTRFQQNRATIRFTATERGLLGRTERRYESQSILVDGGDGTTYLVTHLNNSPFGLGRSVPPEAVALEIELPGGTMRINQIGFLAADPRILFIPLPNSLVAGTGFTAFPLARQPERWEEAVLVKSDESNFGRTEFRRLTSSARFLKMERPALGELFADFAASRGDLAFTKNSQFIGLLTGTSHAVVISEFVAAAVLDLGPRYDPDAARAAAAQLQQRVDQLPHEVR
ncbi:MAG: hypothetical protein ACFCU4_03925 [Puniceicoccaceae bacterium]